MLHPATPAADATVLVIDDDVHICELVSRALARSGCAVLGAQGARSALSLLARTPVDLVLLDVEMPDIDGLSLLRILRMRHASSHLPIMMMTSGRTTGPLEDALALGANDFVAKPLDWPALRARVRAQLAISRTDAVTGLASRQWGMRQLELAVAHAEEAGLTVLAISLRGFRRVNTRGGRAGGDAVLHASASRLAEALEGQGVVARLGGDEFFAFVPRDLRGVALALLQARIREALAAPVPVGDDEMTMTAEVGVAWLADGADAEGLVQRAEAALGDRRRRTRPGTFRLLRS